MLQGGVRAVVGSWRSPHSPLLSWMFPEMLPSMLLGLTGLPLLKTDCLLLILHLAGITSVFYPVICCPIATCNPFFLLHFLPRRFPQHPTWDPWPPILVKPPWGTFCFEKQNLAPKSNHKPIVLAAESQQAGNGQREVTDSLSPAAVGAEHSPAEGTMRGCQQHVTGSLGSANPQPSRASAACQGRVLGRGSYPLF